MDTILYSQGSHGPSRTGIRGGCDGIVDVGEVPGAVLSDDEVVLRPTSRRLEQPPVLPRDPRGETISEAAVLGEHLRRRRPGLVGAGDLLQHDQRVAHVAGDPDQPLLYFVPHVCVAVGEAIEARELIRHRS